MRSPLNPDVLQYVTVVAQVGSIRRAAERLHISASALNRQLLILEDRLGTRLFEREARGMRPTQSGVIILNVAREFERGFRAALEQVNALRILGSGRVGFGMLTSFAETFAAPLIGQLRVAYPAVRIEFYGGNSSDIVHKVLEGDLDFGLCWDPPASTPVRRIASAPVPIGVAVRPGHTLARRASVRLRECLDGPVVFPSRGMELRSVLDRINLGSNAFISPTLEANSVHLLRQLSLVGPDPVMMTANAVVDQVEASTIAFVPLDDPGCDHLVLSLFERDGIGTSPAADALRDALRVEVDGLRMRLSRFPRAKA